jgi:Cu/Ag efflux pump CusA
VRFSRFFIDRPIFAVVLSLVILAGGLIAVTQLPISEYPEVTPPTITVSAIYPGQKMPPRSLRHVSPRPVWRPMTPVSLLCRPVTGRMPREPTSFAPTSCTLHRSPS